MKIQNPRLWIGISSATFVLCVALANVGRKAPGPLAAVHDLDPDLRGQSNCDECHGGWGTSMSESCRDCHEAIDFQMTVGTGLHGNIDQDLAARCATCHSEHHGSSFAIVNSQSFAKAGIPDPDFFDHALLGFPMEGKHLEQKCEECHENADQVLLERGGQRFIGLEWDCRRCHDDHHEGSMVVDCFKCHGQTAWEESDSFGHEEYLPLIGGHLDETCLDCHLDETRFSLDALGTTTHRAHARECLDCHNTPHAEDFVEKVAQLTPGTLEASCGVCHEPEHETFGDEALEVSVEEHALSGFALDYPHDEAACDDCHEPESSNFAVRYPGRSADACSACHDDPHGGQFREGPFADAECTACHGRDSFEPHVFTDEQHDLSALPLSGSHLELDCEACHVDPPEEEPRVFHGTPSGCAGCHEDAHLGFFDELTATLAKEDPPPTNGECARCHLTTNFQDMTAKGFDHALWTGFAVLGAHSQSECEICHPKAHEPDDAGRAFGRVEEQFGAFEGCVTCHADPHEGLFDVRGMPSTVEGRAGCSRCHVQASFRTLTDEFDHNRWTGFALGGAHGEIGCSECHAPLRRPDELGRTWARALGSECSNCHEDPHVGQFDVAGSTSCQRCHRSAETFSELFFHHDAHSRFALGDAHAEVACAECHQPRMQDGVEFVHYRPIAHDCVDCHGTQEDPLRRRQGTGQ